MTALQRQTKLQITFLLKTPPRENHFPGHFRVQKQRRFDITATTAAAAAVDDIAIVT